MIENMDDDTSKINPATDGYNTISEGRIDSVRVRLPPFWPQNPATWFIQAEAQFQAYRITNEDTKYCLTIGALPPESCDSIIDILSNPPDTERYKSVKSALIKRHSISETKRLETLIAKTDIGDRSPSELLRSMRQMAGQTFNESIIKNLWLRKLPQVIHVALVAVGDKPLNELAEVADKIHEAQQNATVFAIAGTNANVNDSARRNIGESDFDARLSRIEAMIAKIDVSHRHRRERGPFRRRSSNRNNRPRSISTSSTTQTLCWYHRRFGDKATKCRCPTKSNKNNPN